MLKNLIFGEPSRQFIKLPKKSKIIKSFFTFLIGIFLSNSSNSQSIETLRHNWQYGKSDTAKINAGLKLIIDYYYGSNDSLFAENKILKKIYNASIKCNYQKGIIESSCFIGNNYTSQGLPQKAIEYFYISLKISEKYHYDKGIARAKMSIGIIYYGQNNWAKAIEFFKGSLIINKNINEIGRVATQQYLIGFSLSSLNKFEEAKNYIDSSLKIKFEIGDRKGINECRFVLANIYKGQQKFDSALKYYNQLLPIFLSEKEYTPVSYIYASLAQLFYSTKEYDKAKKNALLALGYSKNVISPLPKLAVYEILYKIYKVLGDYKQTYNYFNQFNTLKDSVENIDYASKINLAQATYEFEKQQAIVKAEQDHKESEYKLEIQDKNFKQTILGVIAIIAMIFVIIIVFAYRWVSKQKVVSESLLLNILPMATVLELKKFGKSLPKNHQGVTIMFCDIKNFSHIAESLTPEQVVEMLDTYFQKFDLITEKNGIEKIKTIGDAYMCAGGLRSSGTQSVIDTIEAAKEFLSFNNSIEEEMLQKYNHAFHFRIGIHTGNVVSGVVGLKKYSYDIWGDAVNISARMEQNSIPGKINISGSTHEIIKNTYSDCEYRGKIPVKNKGEIDMYFIN